MTLNLPADVKKTAKMRAVIWARRMLSDFWMIFTKKSMSGRLRRTVKRMNLQKSERVQR